MNRRFRKILFLLAAAALFIVAGTAQRGLNTDREALGLSLYPELKGAPPVLELTTVALGGFRGLISNFLWLRATQLQDDGKYFEMVQLSDWVTKLEPHFPQVWYFEAWNMAYNISVKFKDFGDRWRWVQQGIELLRDQGIRDNPYDVQLYRELGQLFFHKMGANMDDAQVYYKFRWAREMSSVFASTRPNWDELINPQTDDQRKRADLLRDKYKMDPVLMKQLDSDYGPLEWRLPEASAIYWAARGLQIASNNVTRVDQNDLIRLRRLLFQSMLEAFQRGRIIQLTSNNLAYGPNLEMIPQVNHAYEVALTEEKRNAAIASVLNAHRNFLKEAVMDLYTYNRTNDAAYWYEQIRTNYPNAPLLLNDTNSTASNLTLQQYAVAEKWQEIADKSQVKVQAILEGTVRTAYKSLVVGEQNRYVGNMNLATELYTDYQKKVGGQTNRLGILPLKDIKKGVLDRLLTNDLNEVSAKILASALGVPLPLRATNAPPAGSMSSTNSVPSGIGQ